MSKKLADPVKDGLTGLAIGTAIIVPGISGGTIALVFGAFKKIVNAVDNLFSKFFWKNLLILLPFLIGAVIAVAALIYPFQLAFEYCMFSIVCLFAGFILGSIPGITDEVKGEKPTARNFIQLFIGLIVAGIIGVLSVIFDFNSAISELFSNVPIYLYFIIFAVGVIGATGLIVPGFSGSMLLLVIGFYKPILFLVKFENFWRNLSLLAVFAVGVLVGFILFSKLMNFFITNHKKSTMYVVIGFVCGSLISIFVNSNMFSYFKSDAFGLLDYILGPSLLIVGLAVSYLFTRYKRKLAQ